MPNYLIMDRLARLGTLIALIVPGAAGVFGVFFRRQFFFSFHGSWRRECPARRSEHPADPDPDYPPDL